jgi:hypothetical protein
MPADVRQLQADFAMFDQRGQLAAIAEAKKRPATDATWAAAWFRNYLAHQQSVTAPYMLLITPEKMYLWKRTSGAQSAEPSYAADARKVFSFYLKRSDLHASELSGETFEFLVGTWLNDLAHRVWQPSEPEERRLLVESGLLEAVADGRVVSDIAA